MKKLLIRITVAAVLALILNVTSTFAQDGRRTSIESYPDKVQKPVEKVPTMSQQRKQVRNDMYAMSVMRQLENGEWAVRPSAGFPNQFVYHPQLSHVYVSYPYGWYRIGR